MNNKTDIDVQYVSPLKKILMTIGELPSSYLETMSYYEMLVWFTEFLRNQVIPAVNNNAEAVQELQSLYEELRQYVNNYFDNLDVQEEINNKLDEMAESGQLTDIIAQYLGLAGMIAFDTVADMKLAENLVNGSKCRTLGYHSVNDGGGAYYKIRTVTNDDVVNEMDIIAVYDNTLVAELIATDEVNIEQLGAIENNNISTILSSTSKTVINLNKNYKINSTINLSHNITINGNSNEITIETNETIFNNDYILKLLNITFDCKNLYFPAHVIVNNEETFVKNCKFINFKNIVTTNKKSIILNNKKLTSIDNLFKNIICLGNNIIDDDTGILRCIHSVNESNDILDIFIENCEFININTVDSNEDYTIDDADAIVIQGQITNKNCYINNCNFLNSGRRAIKLQSNNANISNITAKWNNNYQVQSLIQIQGSNININNINGDVGIGSQLLFIINSNSINIKNIKGFSTFTTVTSGTASCLTISNSSNVNIENGYIDGFSKAINVFGLISKFINFKKLKFINTDDHILLIQTRTQSETTPTNNCDLENINIENCDFHCKGNATDRIIYVQNSDSTKHIVKNINLINTSITIDNVNYTSGAINFSPNVNDILIENCKLNVTNTLSSQQLIGINGSITIINSLLNQTGGTNVDIRLNTGSYGFIENTISNMRLRLMDGANSKVISNYNSFLNIMGNDATNSIINTRV